MTQSFQKLQKSALSLLTMWMWMYGGCCHWQEPSGVLHTADTQMLPLAFQLQPPWENLFDTFSQRVTLSQYSMPYCSVCQWRFQSIPCSAMPWKLGCSVSRKLLSSAHSSAAFCTPAPLCLLRVSRGAEVHNHTGCCFLLTASGSFWQSQIVSFYANFGWLVTLTRFRETVTASRYVRDIAGILKIRRNHGTESHLGLSQGILFF